MKLGILDVEDRFVAANAAMCESFESPERLLEGSSILQLIRPDDHARYLDMKRKAMEDLTEIASDCDLNFRLVDGSEELLNLTFCVVRRTDGSPACVRVILRTDFERRQNQASNVRGTGQALRSAPVICAAVDNDGIFIRCDGFRSLNVVPKVIGRSYEDVYAENPEARNRIRRALAGEAFECEVKQSGFWYQIWYEPLLDASGEIRGASWTSFSIDKQKLTEFRLERALEREKEAMQVREDMLSMASHEIKNPLTALSLHIQGIEKVMQTAESEATVRDKAQRFVSSGRRQINRISTLTEKILDASAIHEHGLTLSRARCDLARIVEEVVQKGSDQAKLAGCEIRVERPPNLEGEWDPVRIEQVIENLFSNAVKYGRGRPVLVRLTSLPDRVCLEVHDQGFGIPPEDREKIFERYARCREHQSIKGFGMGLYITRQIVLAHEGSIQVESQPGEGARFRVELPFRSA